MPLYILLRNIRTLLDVTEERGAKCVSWGTPLSQKTCLVVFEGLPKFLANMTNETFQACHFGTHLAIEEMPQTVQPGQTRQTRLNCFVFY